MNCLIACAVAFSTGVILATWLVDALSHKSKSKTSVVADPFHFAAYSPEPLLRADAERHHHFKKHHHAGWVKDLYRCKCGAYYGRSDHGGWKLVGLSRGSCK